MIRGPSRYALIEHTADTGVEVRAADLSQLFESAAAAMFDIVADLSAIEPEGERERVELAGAPDPESLLVDWLSELLGRAMASGRVYCEFDVRALAGAPDGWRLEARVAGAPLAEHQAAFRTELKAVTWHGLSIRGGTDGYVARVVFDQ